MKETAQDMRVFLNLLSVFGVMVALLLAIALMGGVGSIELTVWTILLFVLLVVVAKRSRRGESS